MIDQSCRCLPCIFIIKVKIAGEPLSSRYYDLDSKRQKRSGSRAPLTRVLDYLIGLIPPPKTAREMRQADLSDLLHCRSAHGLE